MSKYAAFFVSTEIHKRTVELADGSKHEVHFRELPVSMYRKFQIAEQSEDEDVRAGSMARMISASLCEADGSPAMTYKQALNLKPHVSSRLFNEVISLDKAEDKGKRFAARGDEWFIYELALALGGRTVAEWRNALSREELDGWREFYRLQPFDDFHRFHRPAALIALSMSGGDISEKLDWLQPPASSNRTSADLDLFKAAGIRPPPRNPQ